MGRWAALVGAKGEGRPALEALLPHLRPWGLRVGGFLPRPASPTDPGQKPDLQLENLATGERIAFARVDEREPEHCSYRFEPRIFEVAASWILAEPFDLVVLGGLGPFEAARQGHWELLVRCTEAGRPLPLAIVRRDSLAAIALALPAEPVIDLDLPADEARLVRFARELSVLARV